MRLTPGRVAYYVLRTPIRDKDCVHTVSHKLKYLHCTYTISTTCKFIHKRIQTEHKLFVSTLPFRSKVKVKGQQ